MEDWSILFILPIAFVLALPVWAIIDMYKLDNKESKRLNPLWILLVIVFPILGSIIYFQLVRKFIRGHKRVFNPDFSKVSKH